MDDRTGVLVTADQVVITGDQSLGEQLVANLAFTI